jgi:hypothetical protein
MVQDYSSQGKLKNNRAKILTVIALIVIFALLINILQDVVNKNINLLTMAAIVLLVIIAIPVSLFVADLYLYEGE